METRPKGGAGGGGQRIGHRRTTSNAAQKRCGSVRLHRGLHEGSLGFKDCASAPSIVGVFAGWRRF